MGKITIELNSDDEIYLAARNLIKLVSDINRKDKLEALLSYTESLVQMQNLYETYRNPNGNSK